MSYLLIIATPEREVYRDTIDSVSLPTIDGEITVLPHHVPLSTILKPGELIIRKGGEVRPYAVSGGFIEVQPQQLIILADTAEHLEEIDEQRAQEAIERAKKLKEEMRADHVEYALVTSKLERDLNRLKLVRKYKHRAHHGIPQEGIRKD
ncbi:MAG: ATP synthase F1 subunit epsilon [Patescibacteria group bacterium]